MSTYGDATTFGTSSATNASFKVLISATVKNPVIHNLKRLAREIKDSTSFVISSGEYKGVYIVDYKTRGIFKECQ